MNDMNPTEMALFFTQWEQKGGTNTITDKHGYITVKKNLKYEDLATDMPLTDGIECRYQPHFKVSKTNKTWGDNQSELHTLRSALFDLGSMASGDDPLMSLYIIIAIFGVTTFFNTAGHCRKMPSRTEVQKICVRKEQISGQESHGGAASPKFSPLAQRSRGLAVAAAAGRGL
jgi:hypothetical protein